MYDRTQAFLQCNFQFSDFFVTESVMKLAVFSQRVLAVKSCKSTSFPVTASCSDVSIIKSVISAWSLDSKNKR